MRDRVLDGVADLLAQGQDLTYAKVAAAADVPERTVYRYFPTRQDLMTAVVAGQRRTGRPRGTTRDEAIELVRQLFPIFDELAPIVRELMAPEGLAARLDDNDERRAAARAVVDHEAPGLDDDTARRLAAVVQVLTSAATWQTLRDYWDMDGAEAAETVASHSRCSLRRCPMTMLTGVNHVAVLTADLDRFVEFYRDVSSSRSCSARRLRRSAMRSCARRGLVDPSRRGCRERPTAPRCRRCSNAGTSTTSRSVPHRPALRSVARSARRAGATDGDVEDLGAFHSIWFTDPDGMHAELTLIVDATLQGIHARTHGYLVNYPVIG